MEASVVDLKQPVESQHGCTATLAQSVPVKETFGGKTVWEGIVHVFKIKGHPKANQAYAWSSAIEGSDKRPQFQQFGLSGRASKKERPQNRR